jgi:hypothetical protein
MLALIFLKAPLLDPDLQRPTGPNPSYHTIAAVRYLSMWEYAEL